MELNKIYNEDCLEGMKRIPDKSVDMILCDLPYAMTDNDWDVIIPFDKLWEQYDRVIKDCGVIALTGSQPFTTLLGASNLKKLRYGLIWEKNNGTNYLQVKKQPFKIHEDILIFYDDKSTAVGKTDALQEVRDYLKSERDLTGLKSKEIEQLLGNKMSRHYFTDSNSFSIPSKKDYEKLQSTGYFQRDHDELKKATDGLRFTYNPQMSDGKPIARKRNTPSKGQLLLWDQTVVEEVIDENEGKYYPTTIIKAEREVGLHPTQKPVGLFEWLIKTYSNEKETILDNCMGSGTTAIACMNTGRNFIGFEKDETYYKLATQRIADHKGVVSM